MLQMEHRRSCPNHRVLVRERLCLQGRWGRTEGGAFGEDLQLIVHAACVSDVLRREVLEDILDAIAHCAPAPPLFV
jgi:hypothetical protein